ncbi:MAG: hypothetical protein ACOC2L_00340, partial [Candidatus Sumerlaeota bacterium]
SSSWELQSDGSYVERSAGQGEASVNAQQVLMNQALRRTEEARIQQREVFHPQGPGTAPGH